MEKVIKKKVSSNYLMSVDPSINNLGMAIWDEDNKKLLTWQYIHPKIKSRTNEFEKSYSMLLQLKEWGAKYEVNKIICEVPEHWAVAGFEARETGSIAKLCFVCGLIYSMRLEVDEMILVKPREWKGQLPKEVVANRLFDEYMEKYELDMVKLNPNVMDGIAIGHFKLFGSV